MPVTTPWFSFASANREPLSSLLDNLYNRPRDGVDRPKHAEPFWFGDAWLHSGAERWVTKLCNGVFRLQMLLTSLFAGNGSATVRASSHLLTRGQRHPTRKPTASIFHAGPRRGNRQKRLRGKKAPWDWTRCGFRINRKGQYPIEKFVPGTTA